VIAVPSELSQGKYRKCKDADEVSEVIKGLLDSYATEVRSKIATTSEEIAVQCAQRLRQNSPSRTGKYKKGWAVKEMRTSQVGMSTWVVHNKKHYRLTHLLEFGHKARGGTRIVGKRPHIKKAEEWANKEFPKELENNLRKG
jgi:hypothetical protein